MVLLKLRKLQKTILGDGGAAIDSGDRVWWRKTQGGSWENGEALWNWAKRKAFSHLWPYQWSYLQNSLLFWTYHVGMMELFAEFVTYLFVIHRLQTIEKERLLVWLEGLWKQWVEDSFHVKLVYFLGLRVSPTYK